MQGTKRQESPVKSAKVVVKVSEGATEQVFVEPAVVVSRSDWFGKFATQCSHYLGSRWSFAAAIAVIVVWAVTGPFFHYSDTWQLVINTGTTIVTFLMVFLIQATQNRDTAAIQLKLDELIMATKKARDHIAAAEDLGDEELESLKKQVKVRKAN